MLSHSISYKAYVERQFADLISEYLANRKRDITLIENALRIGDFNTIRTIGHSMKVSSRAFRLDRITQISHALEEAVSKKIPSSIHSSLDDLNDYLLHVHITYKEE